MNDTSWGRTVFATIRNDIELRHSLFSALFAAALIHMIYLFSPLEFRVLLLLITFPLSIMLSVILCGWRARWNATQASLLGGVFSFSLLGSLSTGSFFWGQFARYCACIAAFHYGEFLATALTNRADLKQSSYLLDHSLAYWAAAAISWCEYWLEVRYLPVLKSVHVGYVGLLLVICGECLRKLAMVHAKGGFTHLVAQTKRPKHKLVTDGVYGLVRHPGYLGWLVWCLGTQVIFTVVIIIRILRKSRYKPVMSIRLHTSQQPQSV